MILDMARFLDEGKPRWSALDLLLTKVEAQSDCSAQSIAELEDLYQEACADLALLRDNAPHGAAHAYLEGLIQRVQWLSNSRRKKNISLLGWFVQGFPRAFRRRVQLFYWTLLITLLGSLLGAGALLHDPQSKSILMPFSHLIGDPAERIAQEERPEAADRMTGRKGSFSAYLMQNNIRVAFTSLALGMTYGIGTTLILFYNGVALGAVCADYIQAGGGVFLAGWLLPHGIIEIPAILFAAQAGLLLAMALFGKLSRGSLSEQFALALPDAVHLAGGAAVLLVWAGLIEAFFSQYHAPLLPYEIKIAFGVVEGIGLFYFLGRSRRAS